MQEFKIRSSAVSNIMASPKGGALISVGAQTYCETWLKEQIYGSKKEFSSKYTSKGNEVEENSIDFLAANSEFGMLFKNEEHYQDEFKTGTPDIITADLVIDIKNSWDCFSFPFFSDKIPNKDYYWQLQSYMSLTGKEKAKLIYILSDTPAYLIEKEAYYKSKAEGFEDLNQDIYEQLVNNLTYPEVDNKLKIKTFEIERNDEDIERINSKVKDCRKFIETLKAKIK